MGFKLSAGQKDEIRRLTQLANRRIKNTERAYKKEGLTVLPSEIVGDKQIKEKWATSSTPISRSVKFEDKAAYKKQLKYLKSFELYRPGIKEYTDIQKTKILAGVETGLGVIPPEKLQKRIGKMSAPELSKFWDTFSNKSARMGFSYSSSSAFLLAMNEYFSEDLADLFD